MQTHVAVAVPLTGKYVRFPPVSAVGKQTEEQVDLKMLRAKHVLQGSDVPPSNLLNKKRSR